jgi:hypothetical protein
MIQPPERVRASAAMANQSGVDFVSQLFFMPPTMVTVSKFAGMSIDATKGL